MYQRMIPLSSAWFRWRRAFRNRRCHHKLYFPKCCFSHLIILHLLVRLTNCLPSVCFTYVAFAPVAALTKTVPALWYWATLLIQCVINITRTRAVYPAGYCITDLLTISFPLFAIVSEANQNFRSRYRGYNKTQPISLHYLKCVH